MAVKFCIPVISLTLLLCACGPSRYEPLRNVYRSPAPVLQGSHTVQPGETLYSIAWRYNRDHEELAQKNGISAPYRIYPGQVLSLDAGASYKPKPAPATAKRSTSEQTTRYKKPETNTKPVQEKVANQRHKKVDMVWSWPTSGPVIETFSLQGRVNKGIDLAGKQGEPVFAAADGKVVYSGTGLVGYGNLIIIKHNDSYLSAYAHNSRLLLKEGESAKAGQKIAEIGSTGTNRDKLHFEIRRDGKPVNPISYLPRR
ncbi:peptidoglycan DD-metalloendopeptidase family protein [Ketobacter sp.]|uniref:peptidoglycan DD-metalloendopeptidase family protein n=1 Tax=Ketobacter sp. TaxID=2083498 RepID=UPI000F19762F|nr:peptidoglycan DD-metalloendopeptidase family protein [Ketobacter sp.]RLT92621.1 MAG: LysM peptidoglycan-binding domain-containing protein [Ketobacter sp.]